MNFWTIARRPRWIALLLLALVVAASFAALGKWQLERSVVAATVEERSTETPVELQSVAEPQSMVRTDAAGQIVSFEGSLVSNDTILVSGRVNHGEEGYWVVGHFLAEDDVSVAVALGWAATEAEAAAVAERLPDGGASTTVVGRYLPAEAPQLSEFEEGERSVVSIAELVNLWSTVPNGAYGGYVVAQEAPQGLSVIDSPAPLDEVQVNWLNLFYAVEWAIFAAFAVYLWYRLVRDALERETYEKEQEAAQVN